ELPRPGRTRASGTRQDGVTSTPEVPVPPLRDLLVAAAETLTAAGIARPADDVDVLIHHVAGAPAGSVQELTAEQAADFAALVRRRADREPLPHLTGTVRFRGIALAV